MKQGKSGFSAEVCEVTDNEQWGLNVIGAYCSMLAASSSLEATTKDEVTENKNRISEKSIQAHL